MINQKMRKQIGCRTQGFKENLMRLDGPPRMIGKLCHVKTLNENTGLESR